MIVYQDNDIIIINKPSGLRTIPDGYNLNLPTVKSIIEAEFGKIWIVHRLDKDTSGILILALNAASHRNLNQQFQDRQIQKTYHTIVVGSPTWRNICIDYPLLVDGDRRHRTVRNDTKGKPAKTMCEVLFTNSSYSLISANPYTGYTHQIRTHLSQVGYPILGDRLYNPSDHSEFLFLHAYSISFTHPFTGITQTAQAPYPPDWECILKDFL